MTLQKKKNGWGWGNLLKALLLYFFDFLNVLIYLLLSLKYKKILNIASLYVKLFFEEN